MGYFGKAEGPVNVKKAYIPYAIDKANYYQGGNPQTPEGINKFLNWYGFCAIFDENGDIEKIKLQDDYVNPERAWILLNSLAEYVGDDSFVSFEGEDGEHWKWTFEDDRVIGGPYPDDDEYGEQAEIKTFENYHYVILKDGTAMLTGIEKPESQPFSFMSGLFPGIADMMNNSFVLPENFDGLPVTAVGANAFGWDRELYGLALPETVKSIGDGAFCGCWSLGGFGFPKSCSYIGNKAFSSCKKIRELDFDNPVKRIGSNVFEQCASLERVSFTEGFTTIPEFMFFMCDKLAEVSIPSSVKCIEKHAFAGCAALSNIELPIELRRIEYSAFLGTGIQSITIPESVTYIGKDAFSAFKNNQVVPNSDLKVIVTAGSYAEQYCKDNALNYSYNV